MVASNLSAVRTSSIVQVSLNHAKPLLVQSQLRHCRSVVGAMNIAVLEELLQPDQRFFALLAEVNLVAVRVGKSDLGALLLGTIKVACWKNPNIR